MREYRAGDEFRCIHLTTAMLAVVLLLGAGMAPNVAGDPGLPFLLKDVTPSTASSSVYFMGIGGKTFMQEYGANYTALWATNGTPDGTVLVKKWDTIANTSSYLSLIAYKDGIYIWNQVYDFNLGEYISAEFWKTDGTAAGTTLIKQAPFGITSYSYVNGMIYFGLWDAQSGVELWQTDGTVAGTSIVRDINPGGNGSDPYYLTSINSTLFFFANDGARGTELWKLTPQGATIVKDICTSPGTGSSPQSVFVWNNQLFMSVEDSSHGRELWRSDGTEAGTYLLADIAPGAASSDPSYFASVNGKLLFTAANSAIGREIWSTDGTQSGTQLLKDVMPGANGSDSGLFSYSQINGAILFSANSPSTATKSLWKTDGTPAGTLLVSDVTPVSSIATFDGALLFTGNTAAYGTELWRTDGASTGTNIVKDIAVGTSGSTPQSFYYAVNAYANAGFFFTADDGLHGKELWWTDGTEAGTTLLSDIWLGANGSQPQTFTQLNNTLFFTADDGVYGREMWQSNGTPAGTTLLKDINPGANGSDISYFVSWNDVMYFSAWTDVEGRELWVSDGTNAGTKLVVDIYPGTYAPNSPNSSSPQRFSLVNNMLFFEALDAAHGFEPWVLAAPIVPAAIDLNTFYDIKYKTSAKAAGPALTFDVTGLTIPNGNPNDTLTISLKREIKKDEARKNMRPLIPVIQAPKGLKQLTLTDAPVGEARCLDGALRGVTAMNCRAQLLHASKGIGNVRMTDDPDSGAGEYLYTTIYSDGNLDSSSPIKPNTISLNGIILGNVRLPGQDIRSINTATKKKTVVYAMSHTRREIISYAGVEGDIIADTIGSISAAGGAIYAYTICANEIGSISASGMATANEYISGDIAPYTIISRGGNNFRISATGGDVAPRATVHGGTIKSLSAKAVRYFHKALRTAYYYGGTMGVFYSDLSTPLTADTMPCFIAGRAASAPGLAAAPRSSSDITSVFGAYGVRGIFLAGATAAGQPSFTGKVGSVAITNKAYLTRGGAFIAPNAKKPVFKGDKPTAEQFFVKTVLDTLPPIPPRTAIGPANDNFANSIEITSSTGSTTGTTLDATREPFEPVRNGSDALSVWYKWTSPTGQTTKFGCSQMVTIYSGSSLATLTYVATAKNGYTAFTPTTGTTYYIAVMPYWDWDFILVWFPIFPPANDNFANATPISGASGTVSGTNVDATAESGEPTFLANHGGNSVWWVWTAPASGSVTIDTVGSSFDTVLGVYQGTAVSQLTTVATNDDSGGGLTSSVTFSAASGAVYYIGVAGYDSSSNGLITLNWAP